MRSYAPIPIIDDIAYKHIEFLQGSAIDLPFKTGEFDLVYTVLALELPR
jgi:ubiquinone/menaquinone biosynthesis C-methylase UbiE